MQTVKRGIFVLLIGLLERLMAAIVKRLTSWQAALKEKAQKRMKERAGVGAV